MSTTETLLEALHAALVASFTAANLPVPDRERAVTADLLETGSGAKVFGSLFDGAGAVDGNLLGAPDRPYEITQRAQFDWVVSSTDRATRNATFDAGLVAIDDAATALAQQGQTEGDPLYCILTEAGIAQIDRSNDIFEGVPHIKAATVTIALSFTSDRPF